MKQRIRILCLLFAGLLLLACGTDQTNRKPDKPAGLWNVSERYPTTYGTVRHAYTYDRNGQMFYLIVSRSKANSSESQNVLSSEDRDGKTYSLCKSSKKGDDTKEDYTYYSCVIDSLRYVIGIEESGLQMENVLSMQEAIDLFNDPGAAGVEGVSLLLEEWSVYCRLDACNLEISVYPGDMGKQYRSLADTYEARSEDGESYLYDESDGAVAYTNGTDTVCIKQINRSGAEHVAYNTVSECKALLALIGQ